MAQKVIKFTLKKGGKTDVEAIGFQGDGCTLAVNNFIETMKAVAVTEPEFTADYHAQPEGELELGE